MASLQVPRLQLAAALDRLGGSSLLSLQGYTPAWISQKGVQVIVATRQTLPEAARRERRCDAGHRRTGLPVSGRRAQTECTTTPAITLALPALLLSLAHRALCTA